MTITAHSTYDEYKDSGVRWIGRIPNHWEVRRSKYLFHQRKELARKGDIQLSATQAYGVIPQADYEDVIGRKVTQIQTNLEKRKHVEIDDFVISMRSFQGGLERAKAVGCIRSSYVILKPGTEIDAAYFAYLLKTPQYIQALQLTGHFIRDGQDLNFDHFSQVDLLAAPIVEQRAIAAFLDDKCAKIDGAVKIKENQIALLRERRQILIQDAVTRGLNHAAPMKDSGIDWISQIPAHWKLKKLKYASSALRTGRTPPTDSSIDHFDDGTVCWYTPGDFKEDGEFQGAEKLISPKAAKYGFVDIYPENSVYFVGIGGTLGRVNISRVKASCNQQFNVILPSEETAPELVLFWLMANRESIYYLTDFSTMPIRNQSQTKNIPIPCPPASEQKQIVGFVQSSIVEIRQIISIKEAQIAALKEYKTSLINAAVTGKIKVI